MNVAEEPSAAAPTDVTETVTVPSSTIVVSAGVVFAVTSPAVVLAPLSVTISVSPRSRTVALSVSMQIVPLNAPADSVSVPLGTV